MVYNAEERSYCPWNIRDGTDRAVKGNRKEGWPENREPKTIREQAMKDSQLTRQTLSYELGSPPPVETIEKKMSHSVVGPALALWPITRLK